MEESDFEEYLVHVDIDTLISNQELQEDDVDINFLGMEDKVILQINNRTFEGEKFHNLFSVDF